MQTTYNPVDFNFRWTDGDPANPRDMGWYEWDSKKAHENAKKARDEHFKELKQKGRKVKRGQNRGQLITRGGIGSNHPQVEFFVTVYHLYIE